MYANDTFHIYQRVKQRSTTIFLIQTSCARQAIVQRCGGCDTILKFHRLPFTLEAMGVLRPSPPFLHVAATHLRHVPGVFPDAHTASAGSDGLELWRLTAKLRQSSTTGRFQLVYINVCSRAFPTPLHVQWHISPKTPFALRILFPRRPSAAQAKGKGTPLQKHPHSLRWSRHSTREKRTHSAHVLLFLTGY